MKSLLSVVGLGMMLAIGCSGCTTTGSQHSAGYDTVAMEPGKNFELARQLNASGMDALQTGNLEKAEAAFKKALDADVMFGPAHNNLGKVYYQQQRYYLAAWEFEYASKLMPNRPEPRNNLGLVFESVGKLNDAVDAYKQAMDIEPDNAELIGNLARARVRRGDKGPEMRELLTSLLMKETRPNWRQWAEQELALVDSK